MDLVVGNQDLSFEVGHHFKFASRLENTTRRHDHYPLEIGSSIDIELNETTFLTFQVSRSDVGSI